MFLLQTSFHLACPGLSGTTRVRFRQVLRCPTLRATSLPVPTNRRKSARGRRSRQFLRRCPRAAGIAAAPASLRAQQRSHRAVDETGAGRSPRSFFLSLFPRAHISCRFRAWTHFSFETAALQVLPAQSAAPQTRLRDAYPVTPPTPLFPRRQCLRCVPASAPVFRAPEKPAETINSAEFVGAPAPPTNESSRWALPADAPANQAAIISETLSRPAWASAAAACGRTFGSTMRNRSAAWLHVPDSDAAPAPPARALSIARTLAPACGSAKTPAVPATRWDIPVPHSRQISAAVPTHAMCATPRPAPAFADGAPAVPGAR